MSPPAGWTNCRSWKSGCTNWKKPGTCRRPEYLEAHAKHDALNDPEVETKAKKMLRGLGYRDADFNRPAKEMSGGWIMRAHLARLLVMEPDLLLLDEPTNHLDLLSLLWLQNYLKNYSGAVLLISHDRQFMDEIVTQVHEISERKLIAYTGNYSDYLRQREERYEQQLAAYKNQQKEIADLQEFADRFRSIPSKASQAQSKLKQIERMELIEKPLAPRKPFRFQIPQPPRGGQRAISLEGIHMAYGANKVYPGLDLTIERGERTVLVGPNGAGKSTLLKILAGVVEFQKGERDPGHNAKIGYFSQHRADTLDPEKTVLEEVLASAPLMREDEARGVLGSFHVPQGRHLQKDGGPERRRKKPAEPDQIPRRPAEPAADGRTDDAPGHPHRRVAHARAGTLRRHAGVHFARRPFHPPSRDQGAARQRRPGHALCGRLRLFSGKNRCARR